MSLSNLRKDVFTGNFTNAEARLKDWWNGVSPAIQSFIQKVETDEGKILQGLVRVAAQEVIAGGLTTASFVAAAKDVGNKLLEQNITMAQTDVFAALNAAVSYVQAQNTAPIPAAQEVGIGGPGTPSGDVKMPAWLQPS